MRRRKRRTEPNPRWSCRGAENNLEELAKDVLWLEGLEEHNLSRDYWFESVY